MNKPGLYDFANLLNVPITVYADGTRGVGTTDLENALLGLGLTRKCPRCGGCGRVTMTCRAAAERGNAHVCFSCGGTGQRPAAMNAATYRKAEEAIKR